MSYLAIFTYKPDEEIAFTDIKSAQNFLLKKLINKLKNAKQFITRPTYNYYIRYIQSLNEYESKNIENTKKKLEYEENATNLVYNPNNFNTIYHPTLEKEDFMNSSKLSKVFDITSALNNNPELKKDYKEAYEYILSLLPAQHAEIDRTIAWLKDFKKKFPDLERDGHGPSTTKYSSKDLELPAPE